MLPMNPTAAFANFERRVLDVQQRIRDSIRTAGGKPTAQGAMQLFMDLRKENGLQRGTTLREFTSRYQRQAGKSAGNPYVEAIARASSSDERAAATGPLSQKPEAGGVPGSCAADSERRDCFAKVATAAHFGT